MTETPTTRPDGTGAHVRTALTRQRTVLRESGFFPWWSLIALGIASVVLGIVVLAQREAALTVMGALAGIWSVIAGLVRVVNAFVAGPGAERRVLSATVGGVLVLVGVACLRDLGTAVTLLGVVVALAWQVSGIGEAVTAVNTSGGMRTLLAGAAAVSIVAGTVFLFLPRLSLLILVVTTGIGLLLSGAIQVVVGTGLRRDNGF